MDWPGDVTNTAGWASSDTTVASVNSTGFATALGAGSTDISASFSDFTYTWSVALQECLEHPRTLSNSSRCDVKPTFNVEYSSYIPVDHVTGALSCAYGTTDVRLIYMGDGNRSTIRTKEFVNIVPDTQRSSGFFQDTGQSRNYGFNSPANGSTLSPADEDGVPNDCYLWNNAATAPHNFSYDVSFPQAHQGQVHYTGAASNPLETDLATITWDMRTVIDTTNPQSPTAYVNYNHTCYPAHQIKVNGQVIYLYTPPANDFLYITGCRLLHLNPVIGVTSPVPVPTH